MHVQVIARMITPEVVKTLLLERLMLGYVGENSAVGTSRNANAFSGTTAGARYLALTIFFPLY